jgi:hypothetical protein
VLMGYPPGVIGNLLVALKLARPAAIRNHSVAYYGLQVTAVSAPTGGPFHTAARE